MAFVAFETGCREEMVVPAAYPVLQSIYSIVDRTIRPVEAAAACFAAAAMLLAMVLTSADALLRYGLNRPLNFNYFLTEYYIMVAMICMPLAWAFRTGGYIRISFLLHALPKRAGDLLLRAGLLLAAIYISDLAWLGGLEWYDVYRSGEVEMGVIDWPWSWSWIWVPVGLWLLALRLLLCALGPAADLDTSVASAGEDGV
jgi:TRAP-type C4-dicarboxylate transport system permease small subunit